MKTKTRIWWLFLAAVLVALSVLSIGAQTLAQEDQDIWATPTNLSQSGAASKPAIVIVPGATLRVFWWDPFDGTMVADGTLTPPAAGPTAGGETQGEPATSGPAREAWSAPARATIRIPETIERAGEEVTVQTPIGTEPTIIGDASGRAHAFWLGEADVDTGDTPLLYSRLNAGSTSWSTPSTLSASAGSFAVAADPAGTVHVVYVQAKAAGNLPVGLHHRQLPLGGGRWSAPMTVHRSRYLRLLAPEEDSLRLTADGRGSLYAAWQDPNQGQLLLAHSADGGTTWSDPQAYLGSGIQPEQDRVIALPGGTPAVLWAPASDPGRRIVASASGNALQLAIWDGVRWSGNTEMFLRFGDPESGEEVRLRGLSLVLLPPSAGGEGVETLAVMGLDDHNDLWITGARVDTLEQLLTQSAITDETSGARAPAPVNLSQSGAASDPAIVARGEDKLYVFWEDRFDGLTVSDAAVVASTALSGTEEITTSRELWSPPRGLPLLLPGTGEGAEGAIADIPVESMPRMVADASGTVHALWLMDLAPGAATTTRPLMHSQLARDGSVWSAPSALAEAVAAFDVAADSAGALHVAYIDLGQSAAYPAGVYYRRLESDTGHWTASTVVQPSRYVRLLRPEVAHIRVAAAEAGSVYVTWDDPQMGRSLLAHSPDGGAAWQPPVTVGDPEGEAQRATLVTPPGGEALVLWEPGQAGGTCILHQAPAAAILNGSAGDGQQVLEGLVTCPQEEQFLALGEEQVLMVLGSGTDALTLALWDGSPAAGLGEGQWSEPRRLSYAFEDPSGKQVYLGSLSVALMGLPGRSTAGGGDQALVAVGLDQEGDVWATSSEVGALEIVFAPPSPWSAPVSLSQGPAYPSLPAAEVDAEGWLHVLWSEAPSSGEPTTGLVYARWDGIQWTRPAGVLSSAEGNTDQPGMVSIGNRLHAVWSDGIDGEILYSSAFTRDAYTADSWSEPFALPAPGEVGSAPHVTAGTDGSLHVVYAVPVNEGRGIYYTHSSDGGETWSPASQVFDAAAEGWLAADRPQVAVDAQGLLHVAWVRTGLLEGGLPQGVYYAGSFDGGETWSEPFEVAAGTCDWPQVAGVGTGQVHLIWNEAGSQPAWWHRWSLDGGQTWTRAERVSGWSEVSAPAALLEGGSGALYLLGLGSDGQEDPALWLSTWDGQRWSVPEASSLEVGTTEAGLVVSLQPALGRVEALFRAEGEFEVQLWHTGRELPPVAAAPLPTVSPLLTATPVPTLELTATPQPTASFGAAPPATAESSLPIPVPVLVAGGLAALIVAGVLVWQLLWTKRR